MTQNSPSYFHDLDEDFSFLSNFIHCNILSAAAMTKIVLPGMCQRKRGIVINISSASTLLTMPMNAFYSSTKAFISQFSRTTGIELSNVGIIVQTVVPFFVQTKFIGDYHPPRLLTPTAEEFVDSAIQTVGIESYTHGTIGHSIQGILIRSLPHFVNVLLGTHVQKRRHEASQKVQ